MPSRVVISQPMFFPWAGLFEQIRLADVYIHYADVQFSKGSFTNRVQIKTTTGIKWLTVPLHDLSLDQEIREVQVHAIDNWRERHLGQLAQAYRDAPYREEMLKLVQKVYSLPVRTISDLALASMASVCRYYGIGDPDRFLFSCKLDVPGAGSRRVLDLVKRVGGDHYITGHGARNYLDHELFEREGVRVEYIVYQKRPYPQLHGEFTPYVSTLDLIANCGPTGRDAFASESVYWKEFLA